MNPMDVVLDWLSSDQTIATHDAFADIRCHLFDRVSALDAWRWFKQGWEARNNSERIP